MIRIVILLLILSVPGIKISAQASESTEDGYKVFRYPNGSVSSEGLIKNGKPDGYWISYYVTGVKRSEGKYTNHMLDSIWLFYDQVADTTEKISYLYGKKNGYYLKYKKDPVNGLYVWSKELFAGNKREGTAYIFYPDGKIQQTISWEGDRKEGLSKEYDEDGNIITLFEYRNDFLVNRQTINRTDNEGLKQGTWMEFYQSGNVKTEMTYKDDQLHGYYKEYDVRGNLNLTMLYDNGSMVKSGVEDQPDIEMVERYDNNNNLIYSGPFRKDVPVGVHREFGADGRVTNAFMYNDNGLLISEGIVDESGNRNGRWKDFYPDGNVHSEGTYTNNRRAGLWKFYTKDGKVEQTGNYNNGRPDGLWKWYYNNGNIRIEEEYFLGKRDGSFTEFSKEGTIISQGEYTDGERNEHWKYMNGDIIEEGRYIIGLREGQWRSYYIDGTLKSKGNYIQGNPNGQHLFYYHNRRLKEEQFYRNGMKQRTWKKYDEEGNVLLAITYKDDVEVSINGVKINLPEGDTKVIK
jgi:antitoxin component YwqK of YwqJK toxin-antitoxin module